MKRPECQCDPTGNGPHLRGCPLAKKGEVAAADVADDVRAAERRNRPSLSLSQIDAAERAVRFSAQHLAHRERDDLLATLRVLRAELNKEDDGDR
jgi:hypothetical protein